MDNLGTMDDHFLPRPRQPSAIDRDYLPVGSDQNAPTEWFPAARFPTEQFPAARFPAPPAVRPADPLAHEGGLAYGNLPAAPYRAPEELIPQHLAMSPFGASPYQHYPPQPCMQQPYPQMQQAVFVTSGSGGRVNHALHLILTVLSFGLWLPVWIILAIANS